MATTLPPSTASRPPSSGWGVLDSGAIRRRVFGAVIVLSLAFFGLITRLWYLQVVAGADYFAQAQRNRVAPVAIPAPRGIIADAHGAVLARSKEEHYVAIVPGTLPSARRDPDGRAKVLDTLSFLLGTSREDLETRIKEAVAKGAKPYDSVPISDAVDLKTITLIEENQPRLGSSVVIANALKRYYPNGSLAAHVLGYSGLITDRDLEKSREGKIARELRFDDTIGKSGLEREYDDILAGKRGSEEWEVDSRYRPIRRRGRKPETPGAELQLTLDVKLQRAAENALGRARNNGAIVAIDPRDGSVLAMASRPGFDPNIWSLPRKPFAAAYKNLLKVPGHPLLNRPVASRFPPGSTFKMITAAAGLQHGSITPGFAVSCNGGMKLGRFFGCWANHGGHVDLFRAMAGSCDVFFYQTSLRLGDPESSGPTYLAEVAREFGLGSDTGIDLPSESSGLIPDPAWRKRVNRKMPSLAHWFAGNTLNMSIGQGDVLATPLQMALATSAVANGGRVWKPHLLKQAVKANGERMRFRKEGHDVKIDAKYLNLIRQSMREVVTKGTGKPCALPNVAVAGKTGSAEDFHNALPHAWWVCFAPYDKPTIAIAVMVENAGHGSENALPIAKSVLEAAFPQPAKPAAKLAP